MATNNVTYDVDGYEAVTDALQTLLSQYPGLSGAESIMFSTLSEDSGMAFYPSSGAVIASEKRSVTGKVDQLCNYPFYIVYRTAIDAPGSKIEVKEFLDTLGKWLEQQAVTIDSTEYQLTSYPALTDTREVEDIIRESPAYLEAVRQDGVQDWVIQMKLEYRNIYYPEKFRRL